MRHEVSPAARGRIDALSLVTTIPELLTQHLPVRPDAVAYRNWSAQEKAWKDYTFRETHEIVEKWRHALAGLGLVRGARAAMLLPNCVDAVHFDLSVLANALVPVPLHAIDTPKSSAFIINDSGAELLVTNKLLKWRQIRAAAETPTLKMVVITDDGDVNDPESPIPVVSLAKFLAATPDAPLPEGPKPNDLAALVYTSGTTGNPKGVMLTHRNILSNLQGVLKSIQPSESETLLSFLPLSHTFERTASYYLALGLGFTCAFNRSIANLADDLKTIRPTIIMSVPRVYEMIHGKVMDGLAKKPPIVRRIFNWAVAVGWRRFCRENGLPVEPSALSFLDPFVAGFLDKKVGKTLRDAFGDRIHLFISGGAALPTNVAKVFLALGVPIFQGYGMTETSPIISVNRPGSNHPNTVGPALDNIEVRLGDGDEIQVRGPSVMKGYWNRPEATREIFTEDDWLRTGDVGEIYKDGHIRITGRIKEIIVTSTGEKVPPTDLEAAVTTDRLFTQCMVVGDDRPFISALCVVNEGPWAALCEELGLDPNDPASLDKKEAKAAALRRIKAATSGFPNYGVPRQVTLLKEGFTIENGLLTPTLKLKRRMIARAHYEAIEAMYAALAPKKAAG